MPMNFKHLIRLLFSLSITACALALMFFYIWTRGELYRVFMEPRNIKFIEQSVFEKRGDIQDDATMEGPIIYRYFTQMKYGHAYIFGVAMANSSEEAKWDLLKLYASIDKRLPITSISCCLKYINRSQSEIYRQTPEIVRFSKTGSRLTAYHLTCLNVKPGIVPDGIGVTIDNNTCADTQVRYRKPFLPYQKTETKLALCTKMCYGNRSAELIIEWMETYIYLGVDKVISYFLTDLNNDTKRVLEHYATTGILDLYHFEPAASDVVGRRWHPPDSQSHSDKQLIIYDAFERASGYTYFGIIDHDEFLIPSKNRSLKEMLTDLFNRYKTAAGFTFRSQQFSTDWGSHGRVNDLLLGTHITTNVRGPGDSAPKNIYKPTYLESGGVHTHFPIPKAGFKMIKVSAEDGYMRHYRASKPHYIVDYGPLINDTWVAEWSKRIEGKVKAVRQRLFGTKR